MLRHDWSRTKLAKWSSGDPDGTHMTVELLDESNTYRWCVYNINGELVHEGVSDLEILAKVNAELRFRDLPIENFIK